MQIFIPQKLIDLRKKCCLSQDELAKQIGVSRTLVTKWETGKSVPTQDAISSMCSALKCDYNDLTEKSIDEFNSCFLHNKFNVTFLILSISFCMFGVGLIVMSLCLFKNVPADDNFSELNRRNLEFMSWFIYGVISGFFGISFGITLLVKYFIYIKRKKRKYEKN